MEQEPPKFMTPFDCQTIPHWIYTLKLILPYTPLTLQHSLAIFIRFQEMQLTMKHFHGFKKKEPKDNILNDVKSYMDPETKDIIEQMETMMGMMEMMQTMQDFPLNAIGDLFNMKGDSNNE